MHAGGCAAAHHGHGRQPGRPLRADQRGPAGAGLGEHHRVHPGGRHGLGPGLVHRLHRCLRRLAMGAVRRAGRLAGRAPLRALGAAAGPGHTAGLRPRLRALRLPRGLVQRAAGAAAPAVGESHPHAAALRSQPLAPAAVRLPAADGGLHAGARRAGRLHPRLPQLPDAAPGQHRLGHRGQRHRRAGRGGADGRLAHRNRRPAARPGQHRRADRHRQPARLRPARPAAAGPRAGQRPGRDRADARPGPLQAHQRHPRARGGRQGPVALRPAAERSHGAGRHHRPHGRRGVRRPAQARARRARRAAARPAPAQPPGGGKQPRAGLHAGLQRRRRDQHAPGAGQPGPAAHPLDGAGRCRPVCREGARAGAAQGGAPVLRRCPRTWAKAESPPRRRLQDSR